MRITYFCETLLITLSDHPPVETREVNENIHVHLDDQGRAVSLTIEHAREATTSKEYPTNASPQRRPLCGSSNSRRRVSSAPRACFL